VVGVSSGLCDLDPELGRNREGCQVRSPTVLN
jgi:hypothetical protein